MKLVDIASAQTPAVELAASELRYRRLFETARDGILILDAATGTVVDANPFLLNLLGYSHDQIIGQAIWELGFLKDTIASWENFLELQLKEYVRYDDLPLETFNGRRVDVEFISNVYFVDQKKVIQCNIRDITERKRAGEVRTRLATAVEQTADTIVITNKDGIILYANPAFETTTGYTREEAIGQNPRILQSGKQDPEFYQQMWAILNRGEVWRGHFINKRKDGKLYEEEASISPVRDATGKVVNYVASKHDVTHEVQLENQLRQAQKMEAIGRLAGGVAHDFNNLLMGIMGYTELCRDHIDIGHPSRQWLDEITNVAQRSAEITHQLLAFARKQTIAPKILNLNDAVAGMLKLLQHLIGEGIKLAWHPCPALRPVMLDPSQADQILANLCLNARDAMGGLGTISLETGNIAIDEMYCNGHVDATPGSYVFLAVSDDGCGMDPETLTHIFEPFFTTKGVGSGTGLGLATVYGIVKQNHGFINAYSEPGKGTTFKIYFPQVMNSTAEAAEAIAAEAPKGHGETILLVEDENSLRVTCSLFLETYGYKVLSANTPEEAIELSGQYATDIHLLLTDVVMPGMDGKQLAQRICATRPSIKVLYMSGYTADVIAQRGVLEQNTAFMAKPFSRNELAHKVRDVLLTA
jgi:two-component system cell cycle sensor histidine kinase/response regulator CckA